MSGCEWLEYVSIPMAAQAMRCIDPFDCKKADEDKCRLVIGVSGSELSRHETARRREGQKKGVGVRVRASGRQGYVQLLNRQL